MKLALLSDPSTKNGQMALNVLLQSLVKVDKHSPLRVGYIASQPDPHREFFQQAQQMYQVLGAELSVYLELEAGFSQSALDHLLSCDAIHLSGGDTYRFLKGLKHRKLLPVLRQYAINGGGLVGVSAGAMIMTPSIASASLCGDINHCELDDLIALNLVDFMFSPHINQALLQSERFQQQLAPFKQQVCLCPDDASLLLITDKVEQLGDCQWHLQ
ncbi:Type 1 glutamine amidotransferase-like domain-containing protein [Shewanella schlegeliana]|uniref:Type 1 glutamine amidotransferase-like domain-containing protein n=1 Tax=Shewanella schlegeliana TaxID=190308 RepID=A0ABS1STD7_9GAMM|nr:Type 1 glutamine amidotransferase-like domain-containing protein [Shewanella schlegeliana]MBL4911803.1 Type 1 glutamine amidotransferase-like domain-containing protein [Shewanella schlegeliana]MCL1110243.1 Type 1 glutamine amidotransferase-like domain-containing protein [Shewanella schlegeliana]GIU35832.1 hypothetical protein TUM4433_33750 [Shewanella schlegeliana]